jgi:hypothetical protein
MISKTRRRCIVLVAALLCATTASAQENRGTPEQRAACAPTPSDFSHSRLYTRQRAQFQLVALTSFSQSSCLTADPAADHVDIIFGICWMGPRP